MRRSNQICVVGSANVDMTFCTPRLPAAGETLAAHSLHVGLGGKGANQAVAAARLGGKVAFVARVGNDAFGADAIKQYQTEGIDTSFVHRHAELPTGTAAIMVDDNAENSIVIVPGANAKLTADDVRESAKAIADADAVLCQLETPIESALEAFRIARSAGKLTVLTPAPAQELPAELLELCDICVPNQTELELLTGQRVNNIDDAALAASKVRAQGVQSVVVTLGSQGVLVVRDNETHHVPARNVDAVDTTGAGDAFTAAFAVSMAEGITINEAARRGIEVAAITVTRVGTQASFPRRDELSNW